MDLLKTMISKLDPIVVVFRGILEIPFPYKISRQRASKIEKETLSPAMKII